ncbi:MAG: FMN-binding protein [Bacillota bacterium]
MKKVFTLLLCLTLVASFSINAAAETEVLKGTGEGFGGPVTVEVTVEDDEIVSVKASGEDETEGIGTDALEETAERITEAKSTDVDLISGATYTSEAVIYAVNNALNPDEYPDPESTEEETTAESVEAAELYQGMGLAYNGRIGPGSDNTDTPVYSFNEVYANVLFDEDGKIAAIHVDQLEVATPNYDGEAMPHFSGFPGQGGYNMDENHNKEVDYQTIDTDEFFMSEFETWKTKRERGDNYVMSNLGNWADQMDHFEDFFVGMTVDEIEDWFENYTAGNGRPLTPDAGNEEDQEKYENLSEDEQDMLADVTTGATMSLSDAHGYIIDAIKDAYEKRQPVNEASTVESLGFGLTSNGRVGPGSDDTDTQVYSYNNVYVNTLFDDEGKVVSLHVDQLEVATPNYDGKAMPHLSGFPGQGGYNFDVDHDKKVEGKTIDTEENFLAEVNKWQTKRERGDNYVMSNLGNWADQMDHFEDFFVGMTVDEIEDWFENYTAGNGRPLTPDAGNEEDQEKYENLSEDEQDMLADVTTGATMSLSDAHGYIIEAIVESYENRIDLNLSVE